MIVGDKMGRLTIDAIFKPPGNPRIYVNATCDCGNKITTLYDSVRRSLTRSCGCLKQEPIPINSRFGRLVVIAAAPSNGHSRVLCQCDCGQTKIIAGTALRNGRTNSCGCLRREKTAALNKTRRKAAA